MPGSGIWRSYGNFIPSILRISILFSIVAINTNFLKKNFFLFCNFTYIFILFALGLVAAHGLSPTAVSRGSSLVVVSGLLVAAASLVAEYRL